MLIEAAGQIFAAPELSWSVLELEALTRAHRDDDVRALETARLEKRAANMRTVTEQTRRAGGLDDDVDSDALVHFALALSVGLAVIDPVSRQPSRANWNALIARIGASVAPAELLLAAEYDARKPWRLRIDIPDRPGGLAVLVRALSTLHASVVGTAVLASGDGIRTIDLAVTLPEKVTAQTLLAAAMAAGSNGHVTEGSVDDGLDMPTRVLDGATELVTNPGSAPLAAAALVEADRFEVTDATEGEDDAAGVLRLQWTPDQHVVLHRDWAPFARAEQTRASALLRLAAAIASIAGRRRGARLGRAGQRRRHSLDPVGPPRGRRRGRGDARALLRADPLPPLSPRGRPVARPQPAPAHRRPSGRDPRRHERGRFDRGAGQRLPRDPGDGHAAELAEIVEDAYQGRGIGTRLLRHMLELAERLGFHNVVATVLAENAEMLAVLEATGLGWTRQLDESVLTMRAPLPVVESGSLSPGHPRSSLSPDRPPHLETQRWGAVCSTGRRRTRPGCVAVSDITDDAKWQSDEHSAKSMRQLAGSR